MDILSLSCVIAFIISLSIFFWFLDNSELGSAIIALMMAIFFYVSFIIGIVVEGTYTKEQPKEFPANKYILEYKIEVYPAYSDTTYVLLPIK